MELPTTWIVAHIVNNQEIGITECGLMLKVTPVTDRFADDYGTPVPVSNGDGVAIWDDVDTPSGHTTCSACFAAYTC
jgi:hypothetical protein